MTAPTRGLLTEGPIASQLVRFALPLLASSLIQLLYSTVDLLFVGRFVGTAAAAAVGASGLIVTCLIGLATGLSSGAGVVAARFFGAGDKRSTAEAIQTGMTVGLLLGLILTALSLLFAETFLRWLGVPEAILPEALLYLRVYALSVTPMLLYNMAAALLRALGDSMSPMICQLLGGLANVVGNALFIVLLGWGLVGAAVATVATQSLAAGLVVWRLRRLEPEIRPGWRLRWAPRVVSAMGYIGLPASVQAIVITFSNLVVQHRINGLGVTEIAGYAIWFRVENFTYFPAMALGQAITIFVAQNLGARQPGRAKRGLASALRLTILAQAVLSLSLYFGAGFAFGLFSADPEVIAVGTVLAHTIVPWYFLFAVLEVLASTIRGAARPLPPMVIILVALCAGRVVLLGLFPGVFHTAALVALVYPITWVLTVAGLVGYLVLARKSLWQAAEPMGVLRVWLTPRSHGFVWVVLKGW